MTEFLVRIELDVPDTMPTDELDRLRAAESARATELAASGTLLRLWRSPGGGWRNIGLWQGDDEAALHAALDSLPFRPWMSIDVTVLGEHPNDPGGAAA